MLRTTSHARAYMSPEDWREAIRLSMGRTVRLSAKHPKGPYCARSGGEPVWAATPLEAVRLALEVKA